jgi:hypothetical protein
MAADPVGPSGTNSCEGSCVAGVTLLGAAAAFIALRGGVRLFGKTHELPPWLEKAVTPKTVGAPGVAAAMRSDPGT